MRRSAIFLCVGLGALTACSGSTRPPLIVNQAQVRSSSSRPTIEAIHDLGSPSLTGQQQVPLTGGDGVAVIGEMLLVRGEDFGRSPRVTIDGRTTPLLARTADGVVVRVPWGVRAGKRLIKVINSQGEGSASFPFKRFALATVPSRDSIHLLEIDQQRVKLQPTALELPSAGLVSFCAGGQLAFVSGRTPEGELLVATYDMTAPGGPRLLLRQPVGGTQILALSAAKLAPLAVVISDTQLLFLNVGEPQRPATAPPVPLPEELQGNLVAAAVDPMGKMLAVLSRQSNTALLYDISEPGSLRQLASTQVLPKLAVPLLRDLCFSGDSRTLWVVSGDNAGSQSKGRFPLRLTAIRIQMQQDAATRAFGVLSIWRTLDVPHQAAPVAITATMGQPLATGSTIQVPPENAAVFITAHDSKLLTLNTTQFDQQRGLKRAATLLQGLTPLGTMVRTDIQGRGGPLFESPALLSSVDVTSDSQLLLAAGAQVQAQQSPPAVKLTYGVTSCRVYGKHEPVFTPLAEVDPEHLARPFALGDLRIQP